MKYPNMISVNWVKVHGGKSLQKFHVILKCKATIKNGRTEYP